MENKYYTPTIEEFHIGFEYEYLNRDKWVSTVMEEFDDGMTPGTIFCNKDGTLGEEASKVIRVKYLDREDIESFGFGSYIPPHEYDHTWIKDNYILKAWFNHELPTIRIMYIPSTIIFHGAIKNKSELKILLKQLGIE